MSDDPNDDFYKRLRDRIDRWAERKQINPAYAGYLLALPDLFHLVARLMLDKRVTTTDKGLLGVALAYVVMPIDMVPDFFGPVSFLDDLLVVAVILDKVLQRIPKAVVNQHWAGNGDVMRIIRESIERADHWSKGLLKKVREYLDRLGVSDRADAALAKAREVGADISREAREAMSTLAAAGARVKAGAAAAAKKPAPDAAARAVPVAAARVRSTAAAATAGAKKTAKRATSSARGAAKKATKATRTTATRAKAARPKATKSAARAKRGGSSR